MMLTVYVKHYLTPAGLEYLESEWFPLVLTEMIQHEGYLSCVYEIRGDCVDIRIQFKDEPSFDAYAEAPNHDQLAKMLDPYRSRNHWQAVRTTDPKADPSSLEWDVIDPATY
ncbi:MAG: hypothetical protein JSS10_02695 [Verrucomicrobia bacterium]|nr:hypothetical protein [Verrucomicrobiota bacterium]